MKDEYLNLELINNTAGNRFEMHWGDEIAFIAYKLLGKRIKLIHTEVPPSLEGKGAAAAIVEKVLTYCEANGLIVIPLCTYVLSYLKKHPEWNRIVDERMRV